MDNDNLAEIIDTFKAELELHTSQYLDLKKDENIIEPKDYVNLNEDFMLYYPKPQPFQRVLGKIKL